jgi:hypothetical protein
VAASREPRRAALGGHWWLKPPRDAFSIVLRLYRPRGEVIPRDWEPPSVTRVDG